MAGGQWRAQAPDHRSGRVGGNDHQPAEPAAAPKTIPLVELRQLAKRYGSFVAVQPTDLDIYRGNFLAILGPSGCGKTTLLRMIGGLTPPTEGSIAIEGADVTKLEPEKRPTNMVFQGYGLFPHMTVRQNIAYGLRIRKVPAAEMEERTAAAIKLVHLSGFESRNATQLSGGQQQRVALARALVLRPKVLLLDEPLGALDLKLRRAMQDELRRIHHEIGGTFVFVTHDQNEALGLANRIAVMQSGAIVQEGAPEDIYREPRTSFVSTFIGEANVLKGRCENGGVHLDCGLVFPALKLPTGAINVVLRPEDLSLAPEAVAGAHCVAARLEDALFLGTYYQYKLSTPTGEILRVNIAAHDRQPTAATGEMLWVCWSEARQRILPA